MRWKRLIGVGKELQAHFKIVYTRGYHLFRWIEHEEKKICVFIVTSLFLYPTLRGSWIWRWLNGRYVEVCFCVGRWVQMSNLFRKIELWRRGVASLFSNIDCCTAKSDCYVDRNHKEHFLGWNLIVSKSKLQSRLSKEFC